MFLSVCGSEASEGFLSIRIFSYTFTKISDLKLDYLVLKAVHRLHKMDLLQESSSI